MVYAMRYDDRSKRWVEINNIWTDQIVDHGLFGHAIDIHDNRAIIGSKNGNIAIEYVYDELSNDWKTGKVFFTSKIASKRSLWLFC